MSLASRRINRTLPDSLSEADCLRPMCMALSQYYGVIVIPDHFILAKQNIPNEETVNALWALLHAMTCKNVGLCQEDGDFILCTKIGVLMTGYPSMQFYTFSRSSNLASRDLLRVFTFVFTKCHIDSCAITKQVTGTITSKKHFSDLQRNILKTDKEKPVKCFSTKNDLMNFLFFCGGKLSRLVRFVADMFMERDLYSKTKTVPRSFGYYTPLDDDSIDELKRIISLMNYLCPPQATNEDVRNSLLQVTKVKTMRELEARFPLISSTHQSKLPQR